MNKEELKQRLIELLLTDIECDKDGHGDCSMCEYRFSDDGCAKHLSVITAEFLIANGVTIQEHGGWELNKDGSATCKLCGKTQKNVWDFDNYQNFCGHCGADMRGVKDE